LALGMDGIKAQFERNGKLPVKKKRKRKNFFKFQI